MTNKIALINLNESLLQYVNMADDSYIILNLGLEF